MLAIVSPSIRTSAAYEPSAVTIVPLVISVRIGPSWRNRWTPAADGVRRAMVGDGEGRSARPGQASTAVSAAIAGRTGPVDAGSIDQVAATDQQQREPRRTMPRWRPGSAADRARDGGRGGPASASARRRRVPRRPAGRRRGIGVGDLWHRGRRRSRRRRRRRQGERRQLADDRARLDAAVLVAIARAVELERSHVPRARPTPRRRRRAAAAGQVPERATGRGGRPTPAGRPNPST